MTFSLKKNARHSPTVSFLRHPHQGWSNGPAVKTVADLLDVENRVLVHGGVGDLKEGLVLVGVELLVQRVDLLEAVALENLQQLCLRQLQSLEHVFVDGFAAAEAGANSLVEDIGNVEQVLAKTLDAKNLGVVDLLRQPLPHVVVLGNRPPVLVQDVVVLTLEHLQALLQLGCFLTVSSGGGLSRGLLAGGVLCGRVGRCRLEDFEDLSV